MLKGTMYVSFYIFKMIVDKIMIFVWGVVGGSSDVSEVCTVSNFRVFEYVQWLPTKVLTTPSAGFWPQQPSTLFPRVPQVRLQEKNRYWKY
jgi:hypothetical protein